jgi:nucleotide-binding universal stress UspA family protein
MKTILVPLDSSALAEQVLPYVQYLASTLPAKVQLLEVISEADRYNLLVNEAQLLLDQEGVTARERAPEPMSWEFLRAHAAAYLAQKAAQLRAAGIDVGLDVRLGAPAEAIIEAAREQQAAMIAMATHGYSGVRRWALGSVADKVVHAAPVPVFLVRGSAAPALIAPPLKRILVPLDGSALARQALPLAIDLAIRARAELLLMTVVAPPVNVAPELMSPLPHYDDVLDTLCDRLMRELGTYAGELQQHDIIVTPVAVNGFAAEMIVDEAARRGVDLVVMATHGYSGIKRWALGSVADKVLHAMARPLLLVRAEAGAQ